MSMFNDFSCDRKGNTEECLANARVVKVLARRFGVGQWSFIVPISEKNWYSAENSPQGAWDHIADEMLLEFAESGHPIFRATTPLSRCKLKSQGHGKLSIHFTADYPRIETIFRITVSANQLSLYGAVANICEEFETHQDRSGEPDVLMGQSIVLSEIKAEVPLQNENPSHHQILWQQYEERIKSLSQESKVSKFCMDAGFVHVVEVGQYFMTKDTGDFKQFRAVACREYTLPRDDGSSQPRGWIQGNTRIGPVLEVTTSYLWEKYGIEIRVWSLSQDNSHSWVRISHGTNKYVVDSNYSNTEVPADLPEEQASQSSVKVIAARSKAKSKPQKRETVELPSTVPMNERKWIDSEPAEPSLSLRTRFRRKWSIFFDIIKQYNEKMMKQFNSGESSFIFGINLHKFLVGRMIIGKHVWQQEEGQKEDISTALIFQEQFFTSALFKDTQDVISLILYYKTM